jgi:N-acetylneuraminate synthase
MLMSIAGIIAKGRQGMPPVVRPYLIAEAGVNHDCRMDLAQRLIDEAKEGGADAVKFQTYRAETLASRDSPYYWDLSMEPTTSQFQLFQRYDKFWKAEYEELKKRCDRAGIEFLSTPFDLESAAFLAELMPVFKISSSDITNKPFIEHLCGYGKPILLSTGASCLHEIEEAVGWIRERGNHLALMHCVLNYPTQPGSANLGMIHILSQKFPDLVIGYSDHTMAGDMRVLEKAALMGAAIIEKHFTYDKTIRGNDHKHSMDKDDIKRFRKLVEEDLELIGGFKPGPMPSEEPARRNARRSLVAARRIPQGKVIEPGDLTWKRPAHGVSPREIDAVTGMRARRDIAEDEVLQWGMLE